MKVESMKISFFISHQDLTFSLCSIQIFYIINSVLGSRLCTHISQCMFESSRCKNGNESSCERWREEEAQAFAWMEESRWDRKKGNSWNSSFSECCELSSKQHIPSKENICWNFCIKNLHSLFSYRFKLLYRRRHFSFLFSFFHQTKTNVWFSVISDFCETLEDPTTTMCVFYTQLIAFLFELHFFVQGRFKIFAYFLYSIT